MRGCADGQMGRWSGARFRCHSAHLLFGAAALACAPTKSQEAGGTMEATWFGADTGGFRGVATARWCAEPQFGEVLGVHGDTGIAIAIRNVDSLVPGRYGAVLPDSADTVASSATVALRLLGRTAVNGYQSDSGTVTLARGAGGRLRVDFAVRAKALGAAGRITLRGKAAGVPVQRGGEKCTAPWRPSE